MKAIDMTPIIKKYPSYFVALSYDIKKVLGKGHTPEEANKNRHQDPILTKIPNENRSYLL